MSNPGTGGSANTGGTTNAGGSQSAGGASNTGGAATGGASGSGGTAGTGGRATGGAASNTGGATGTGGSTAAGVSTDPNLKIGFIGDTHTETNFTNVLNLVKSEGASALVVEGDMSYTADPTAWWNAVESVLGATYPVFISRGNHDDSSWGGYLPKAANHLGGATREAGAHDANYKTTYRGLVIATIRKGDSGSNITPFLQNDPHIWKICNWHQNQQAMQVGGVVRATKWDGMSTRRAAGWAPSFKRATNTATNERRR
jgi:hypothetical protein